MHTPYGYLSMLIASLEVKRILEKRETSHQLASRFDVYVNKRKKEKHHQTSYIFIYINFTVE